METRGVLESGEESSVVSTESGAESKMLESVESGVESRALKCGKPAESLESNIQKIMDFLIKNPIQILSSVKILESNAESTQNLDSTTNPDSATNLSSKIPPNMGIFAPSSRPFGSAMLLKNKIWYCLNNDKPTFREISANPNICICACGADRSWIRIYAKAVFCDDLEAKEVYLKRPANSFKSLNDPRFSVFYLAQIRAEIHTKGEIEYIEIV
ncbi:hypothetical protein CCY99_07345 [Helicobacter sp. 16-1353]|uniref:pyridoxamine 5'-phosphate oxidase family protein n=1 Tax=Helicobacter sp. 16-1353 TaxID=2004996 RepID=UPI000DCF1AA7|nr:pyridoxamine 5'-phosphate oxidase family protein [Helicobacter sp. 16-1353]RAX52454.1 hypothetical protein CCY99_07345 [Helicobacter sp. 16-1353]